MLLGALALVLILTIGWGLRLLQLNRYSLQTGALMIEQKIVPGWWLNQAQTTSCTPQISQVSANDRIHARGERLYALQAFACGETDLGNASLAATADRLTSDPTVSLILAKDATGVSASPMGANTLAERARQAYAEGDREAAANWLDMGRSLLDEASQYDNQSFYFAACYIYRGLRRLDDSLKACQHYTDVKPNDKEAWNHLGTTYMALKDWPQAEAALRTAIGLDESWLPAQDNLVTVLYRQEKIDAALSVFDQAKQNTSDDAWSAYWLARMALQLGRCDDALSYLEIAKVTDSSTLRQPLDRLTAQLADACP